MVEEGSRNISHNHTITPHEYARYERHTRINGTIKLSFKKAFVGVGKGMCNIDSIPSACAMSAWHAGVFIVARIQATARVMV